MFRYRQIQFDKTALERDAGERHSPEHEQWETNPSRIVADVVPSVPCRIARPSPSRNGKAVLLVDLLTRICAGCFERIYVLAQYTPRQRMDRSERVQFQGHWCLPRRRNFLRFLGRVESGRKTTHAKGRGQI